LGGGPEGNDDGSRTRPSAAPTARSISAGEPRAADRANYTGSIEPTHNEGSEWDGSGDIVPGTTDDKSGVLWEYQYDRFGIGKIRRSRAKRRRRRSHPRFARALADPTYHWAHSCFSNVEGWPQLVGVWAGRLIFVKGVDLIGSVVGDYWNMAPIDKSGIFAPDQAFRLELSISDPPTWLHADKEFLLLGNASEEIVVGQINRAAGISGTTSARNRNPPTARPTAGRKRSAPA
jgi:hypothetical protein